MGLAFAAATAAHGVGLRHAGVEAGLSGVRAVPYRERALRLATRVAVVGAGQAPTLSELVGAANFRWSLARWPRVAERVQAMTALVEAVAEGWASAARPHQE